MLDPAIVAALVNPVRRTGELTDAEDDAAARWSPRASRSRRSPPPCDTTPAAVEADVERLFLHLAEGVSAGESGALQRLRRLHRRSSTARSRARRSRRLLPTGVADQLRAGAPRSARPSELEVTVLMSDIRGYSTIAEHADPAALAAQLNGHRAAMNRAILVAAGTVMQYVGDAVMAVFGAPEPCDDHADRALAAAHGDARRPGRPSTTNGGSTGWPPFGLGIGLSTGDGGRGPARLRGAARVHARRRRREPLPAPAAVRRAAARSC